MQQEPKKYVSDVRSDDEYADLPAKAIFEIDVATAMKILNLAAFLRANNLHSVEFFDYRVNFLEQEPEDGGEVEVSDDDAVRVECPCLVVYADQFKFTAYLKHTNVEIETERFLNSELASHFGLTGSKLTEGN